MPWSYSEKDAHPVSTSNLHIEEWCREGAFCLFQNGDASTAVSMFRTDQKLRIFDPSQFSYLFLPLVWPHGIIGHLGETFGSFTAFAALTLESHPHQITPVILLFDPLIAHSNYMVTGFKILVSYR
jgi:hypothetical protein